MFESQYNLKGDTIIIRKKEELLYQDSYLVLNGKKLVYKSSTVKIPKHTYKQIKEIDDCIIKNLNSYNIQLINGRLIFPK